MKAQRFWGVPDNEKSAQGILPRHYEDTSILHRIILKVHIGVALVFQIVV